VIATAMLYLGKVLFVPLALALLLSFVLGPLVTRLERLGVPRIPSVLAACLCIGVLVGGMGWVVGHEVAELSDRAPEYRSHLERKIEAVRESMNPIHRAKAVVSDLEHQIQEKSSEASSEKMAYGHIFDSQMSLVVGTHTHCPTADAQILPGGTAFQSDAGMCGDYDSVIGMVKAGATLRFWRKMPGERLTPAEGAVTICGVFVETDDRTGLASRIEPLRSGGRLAQVMPSA